MRKKNSDFSIWTLFGHVFGDKLLFCKQKKIEKHPSYVYVHVRFLSFHFHINLFLHHSKKFSFSYIFYNWNIYIFFFFVSKEVVYEDFIIFYFKYNDNIDEKKDYK